ncbi:MAG: hypothetical protein JO224_10745 [Pelomonas sp.]|nr:hypothetical protein [Roseateles sp.]
MTGPDAAPDAFPEGVAEGRAAWQEGLRAALLKACADGAREILCFDADFMAWPWSEAGVLAALTAWAHPPRRLTLVATQYDALARRHPRFVAWRQRYDHCVAAFVHAAEPGDRPGHDAALVAMGASGAVLSLRLLDAARLRVSASLRADEAMLLRQWFDVTTQRSSPGFAATTLGL